MFASSLNLRAQLDRLDQTLVRLMSEYGIHLLCWAIAMSHLASGGLSLINASPDNELALHASPWLPPRIAALLIGGWEVLIGIGLLFSQPRITRATLLLLWLHLVATFLVLFLVPQFTFPGRNLFLPTLAGPSVLKNLVLFAGSLVIGSTVRQKGK